MVITMILTTIFQNITEKLEKKTYFVVTILGVLLLLKVFYATNGLEQVLQNYGTS